jgi:hypothetical protein
MEARCPALAVEIFMSDSRSRTLALALVLCLGSSPLFAAPLPEREGVSLQLVTSWNWVGRALSAIPDLGIDVTRSRRPSGSLDRQPGQPESSPKHRCGIDPNGKPILCP